MSAIHCFLHGRGHRVVERVGRLARLEEDVRVLGGASQDGPVRGETPLAVRQDALFFDQGGQLLIVQQRDLVHLVRGPEAVEKVEKGHPGAQGGGVGHEGEVLRFLNRTAGEQREARRSRGHYVTVIAEDREGVSGDGAGGDVHDAGEQLAGHLEHVGEHQQQSLRGRERRGQCSLLERTVHRTGLQTSASSPMVEAGVIG
jgi:hypothetical protein